MKNILKNLYSLTVVITFEYVDVDKYDNRGSRRASLLAEFGAEPQTTLSSSLQDLWGVYVLPAWDGGKNPV